MTKQYRILHLTTGIITKSSHVNLNEDQKYGSIVGLRDYSKMFHLTDMISDEIFDQEEQIGQQVSEEKLIELPDSNSRNVGNEDIG